MSFTAQLILMVFLQFAAQTAAYSLPTTDCDILNEHQVRNAPACIAESQETMADSRMFWFGDRWHTKCMYKQRSVGDDVDPIRCYNPHAIRDYHSIGERLLRVRPFDMAYLRNLRTVPVVTFTSEPGAYTGCDHRHEHSSRTRVTCAGNCMHLSSDVTPWRVRHRPVVRWHDPLHDRGDHGSERRPLYTLAIVDVAFGTLHFLMHDAQDGGNVDGIIDVDYTPPVNFRERMNPLVIAVFEQTNMTRFGDDFAFSIEADGTFNVQTMMLDNRLAGQLIGLTWLPLTTDAFGMEIVRHRRSSEKRPSVPPPLDNCPSLLVNRVVSPHDDAEISFLPRASLSTVRHWLSVEYTMPRVAFNLCCQRHTYRGSKPHIVDPLADEEITPLFTIHPPTMTMLNRQSDIDSNDFGQTGDDFYTMERRKSRDYIGEHLICINDHLDYATVLMDTRRYTLMLVDATPSKERGSLDRPYLHWMVADIPAKLLARGFTRGRWPSATTLVPYEMATPSSSPDLHRFIYLVLEQPRDDGHRVYGGTIDGIADSFKGYQYTNRTCAPMYRGRCFTDMTSLIARYSLTLRALSWHLTPPDDYSAHRRVAMGIDDEGDVCKRRAQIFYANCAIVNAPKTSLLSHASMLSDGDRTEFWRVSLYSAVFVTFTLQIVL